MEAPYIAVVGGVNVDISGTPHTAFLPGDSNPGHVRVTLGGVGRNIAENLCRLGHRVLMVTALGDDANAAQMRQGCQEVGIDLSHSLVVPKGRTSTYLCLNDEQGEILGAVSDMDIYESLTPAFLQGKLPVLNQAALVVVDGNLRQDSLTYLATHVTAPLFADPVSVKKAARLRDALPSLTLIKPNRPEAALLAGVEIRTRDDLPAAAQALHEKGVANVLISLGAHGVYHDDGTNRGILPVLGTPIQNTNGCGDAFLAAAAEGWLKGESLCGCAKRGLAAAAVCALSESAVSPHMSAEAIQQLLNP